MAAVTQTKLYLARSFSLAKERVRQHEDFVTQKQRPSPVRLKCQVLFSVLFVACVTV